MYVQSALELNAELMNAKGLWTNYHNYDPNECVNSRADCIIKTYESHQII